MREYERERHAEGGSFSFTTRGNMLATEQKFQKWALMQLRMIPEALV